MLKLKRKLWSLFVRIILFLMSWLIFIINELLIKAYCLFLTEVKQIMMNFCL